MHSYQKEIENFFLTHKDFLNSSYPGITTKRLNEEFELFSNMSIHAPCLMPTNFFAKLLTGTPLEYINQQAYFYNSYFYVDNRVLIPRYETEQLVYEAVEFIQRKQSSVKVLDVGTGSGAITMASAIEVAPLQTPIEWTMTDISSQAIQVAKTNHFKLANRLNPSHSFNFLETDRCEGIIGKFDLIISNPPYIPRSEQQNIHHQVNSHEPELALFIEDKSYSSWFQQFFKQIDHVINQKGLFMMEGDERTMYDIEIVARKSFEKAIDIQVLKDLQGLPRYLKVNF